jgi:hypothetical protein
MYLSRLEQDALSNLTIAPMDTNVKHYFHLVENKSPRMNLDRS